MKGFDSVLSEWKENEKELFSKVLWTAEKALEHYAPERKVYPATVISEAFDLSKLDFNLCNYRTHMFEIAHCFDEAEELEDTLRARLEVIELFDGNV